MLNSHEKFGLEFVEDSAIIDAILNATSREFSITLNTADATVGRGLDAMLSASDATSSETSVMRCLFGVFSTADANTTVRRCRLAGCL